MSDVNPPDEDFILSARKEHARLRADLLASEAGAPWMRLSRKERVQLRERLLEQDQGRAACPSTPESARPPAGRIGTNSPRRSVCKGAD